MPRVIAHRGASGTHPENTVAAFQAARRAGADMVELDVRRTADGALAVHHDATLPGSVPVNRVLSSQLPDGVPLLREALEACAGMEVNVELKDLPGEPGYDPRQPLAAAVAALVRDMGIGDRILVSSFDLAAADAARDAGLATAWLTLPGYDAAKAIATCVEHRHRAIHPQHAGVTIDFVVDAHRAGLDVNAWTVDDPARIVELAEWGVDGIVTNFPERARAALNPASRP